MDTFASSTVTSYRWVVDVMNQHGRTWFDIVGSFHSDAMRIVERWPFAAPDRIDYVATVEEPKV